MVQEFERPIEDSTELHEFTADSSGSIESELPAGSLGGCVGNRGARYVWPRKQNRHWLVVSCWASDESRMLISTY